MRKAVYNAYGDSELIQIVDTEVPPLSKNHVLVKVVAAGLNPKDILVRKGKFKRFTGNKFPQGIGFEMSGTVDESNSSEFKKGDKVFGMVNGWYGRCCADYVSIHENELAKAPEKYSFEELAGITLAGQTALQSIRDIGQLENGQKILINGASGGVGTLAIQIAKVLGGHVTSLSSNKNVAFCKSLGADETIAYDVQNILESDERFDVFFDVFGNFSFGKICHLLTKNGVYVTTVPKLDIFKQQIFNLFRRKKAKMVIVKSKSKDIQWLANQLKNGNIKPIIDKVFDLEEIGAAQNYIESKRAKGKVIVKIGEN